MKYPKLNLITKNETSTVDTIDLDESRLLDRPVRTTKEACLIFSWKIL